jgi:hypothetical protein
MSRSYYFSPYCRLHGGIGTALLHRPLFYVETGYAIFKSGVTAIILNLPKFFSLLTKCGSTHCCSQAFNCIKHETLKQLFSLI